MKRTTARQLIARSLFTFTLRAIAALSATSLLLPGAAFSLPTSGVGSGVTITTGSTNLTITTSTDRSIINWDSFSINKGEWVRFIQPSTLSAVLNRVTGGDMSMIYGSLISEKGKVFLINPNGILFGPGAVVNVNGLVASSLDISDNDFLAGRMSFKAGSIAGGVDNQGTIKTPSGGSIYLIAPVVKNGGVMEAKNGDIILAAGHQVELGDSSNPGLTIVVSAPEELAVNIGSIVAEAGRIGLYGGILKQQGVVSADSAVSSGGRIFLQATKDITFDTGSVTSANNPTGGSVEALTMDGNIRNEGSVSGNQIEIISGKGEIVNNGAMTATGALELISGSAGVTNSSSGQLSGDSVVMLSGKGAVANMGDINGKSEVWLSSSASAPSSPSSFGNLRNSNGFSGGGSVTNGGTIESAGNVWLFGGSVSNAGSITADNRVDIMAATSSGISVSGSINAGKHVSLTSDLQPVVTGRITVASGDTNNAISLKPFTSGVAYKITNAISDANYRAPSLTIGELYTDYVTGGYSLETGDITISAPINLPNSFLGIASKGSVTSSSGITASLLGVVSGGQISITGGNRVSSVVMSASGGIFLENAVPLTVATITVRDTDLGTSSVYQDYTFSGIKSSGGSIVIDNYGGIDTKNAPIEALGGNVSLTAHSPLTVGTGGISAGGDVTLIASPSGGNDDLTLNGLVYSANGSVFLTAGGKLVINVSPYAPNGTVTKPSKPTDGLPPGLIPLPPVAPLYSDPWTSSEGKQLAYAPESSASEKGTDTNGEDKNEEKGGSNGQKTTGEKSNAKTKKKYCN